jgi:hypothetical protein
MTFAMDTFLPQTAIDYPVLLKKALAAGDYRANVTLRVPGGQTVTASPAFSVSQADVKQVFTSASPTQAPPTTVASSSSSQPWAVIAAIAAAVVIVLLLLWLLLRRRKRRRWSDTSPETLHPSPATLAAAIAERRAPSTPAEPEAEPVDQVVPAEPAVPAEPPPRAEQVSERPAACKPYHFWDVAYDRGQLGGDGVWRFPHRCQNCGLELLASDVADASAQADKLAPPA